VIVAAIPRKTKKPTKTAPKTTTLFTSLPV